MVGFFIKIDIFTDCYRVNGMDTQVVIMAGGIGSRLWPVSTPEMPKQFIDVLGTGRTLIQLTVDRFKGVCPMENFWVVTSGRYVDIVRAQLPGIPEDNILAEPEPRNTAPCIAYACWKISQRHPDANIVVTPSDAIVIDREKFVADIRKALAFTEDSGNIVTVGITPVRPETGYGYIHSPGAGEGKICKVSGFREKPDLETAGKYLAEGGFFWNAGIFIWNVRTIETQMRRFAPQIASVMDELAPSFYTRDESAELARLFGRCEKISIDYAVMEKSDDIYVIADNPGWSDLGSWGAVREHIGMDAAGNAVVGDDVRLFGCSGCVVQAEGCGTVVLEGLDGYVVARRGDDLLVCRLSEEQHIKEFSAQKK